MNKAAKNFKEFADTREAGAEKIAGNAKEKGGLALLTWHHFKVKLPYYKKAAAGKFDLEEAEKEFKETYAKISTKMPQIDFQTEVGRLEVLGELIIKNGGNAKAVNETIEHVGNKWKVFSKKKVNGKRKLLGTHSTKEKAVDQLQAIEISKMRNESKAMDFSGFLNESNSKLKAELKGNDYEMVSGIADILKRVKDKTNRLEIAKRMVSQFKREKIKFDYDVFLKMLS